jgi:hypothetical protein
MGRRAALAVLGEARSKGKKFDAFKTACRMTKIKLGGNALV